MSVHQVRAGSVDLTVTELGSAEAPPVLVLHGFTGSAEAMGELSSRLSHRCRVVVPDLVGHGGSDAPEGLANYTAEAMVAQLDAVVASIDGRPVDVVGYSMGARAALTFTVARPDRIRRLVLLGATAGLDDPHDRRDRVAHDDALAEGIERDGIATFVAHWETLPLWTSRRHVPDETRSRIRRCRLAQRPTGLANSLRGFGTGVMPSLWPQLPDVGTPTLLLVGELDAKFREIGARMADALPSAELRVIAGAGHAVHVDAPDDVADACFEHLGW